MNIKRVIATAGVAALLISPLIASADTLSDLQTRIDALLSELAALQSQMQQLQSSAVPTTSTITSSVSTAAAIRCPVIARTVALGASGSDVSQLQTFLARQGVYSDDVTGYFGVKTQAAVQAWQSQQGLVSSGAPESTGWGVFGPRSINSLTRFCQGTPIPTTPQSGSFAASVTSGTAPLAVRFTVTVPSSHADTYLIAFGDGTNEVVYSTIACAIADSVAGTNCPDIRGTTHTYASAGTYTAVLYRQSVNSGACYGAAPCGDKIASTVITVSAAPTTCTIMDCAAGYHVVGPSCSTLQSCVPDTTTPTPTPTSSLIPVVSGVDGPASLSLGQTGTWTVHAAVSSKADQQLRYSVTWGDESVLDRLNLFAAGASGSTVAQGTFTHAYTSAGSYTPLFTVANSAGSSQASASVKVAVTSPINCPVYSSAACPAGTTNGPGKTDGNGCFVPGPCIPVDGSNTITATPSSGAAPLAVLFQTYAAATKIDFGDGSSQQINPFSITTCSMAGGGSGSARCPTFFVNHTYSSAGTYKVTITNEKYNDCTPSSNTVCAAWVSRTEVVGTATVVVTGGTTPTPTGGLSVSPSSGAAPLSVTAAFPSQWQSFVQGECSNTNPRFGGRTFSIDWGDGSYPYDSGRSSSACGKHTYTTAGNYTVKARIYDFSDVAEYNGSFTQEVWTGSASVSVTGLGVPNVCPAYQIPICPAGQVVACPAVAAIGGNQCPGACTCVANCSGSSCALPMQGSSSFISSAGKTDQLASALTALQAALGRLVAGLAH